MLPTYLCRWDSAKGHPVPVNEKFPLEVRLYSDSDLPVDVLSPLPVIQYDPEGTAIGGYYPTVGDGTGTVSNTAVSLATITGVAVPPNARGCYITVETAGIRYWTSGGVPTATLGHPIANGGGIAIDHPDDLANALFIRTAGDAVIMVTYKG